MQMGLDPALRAGRAKRGRVVRGLLYLEGQARPGAQSAQKGLAPHADSAGNHPSCPELPSLQHDHRKACLT